MCVTSLSRLPEVGIQVHIAVPAQHLLLVEPFPRGTGCSLRQQRSLPVLRRTVSPFQRLTCTVTIADLRARVEPVLAKSPRSSDGSKARLHHFWCHGALYCGRQGCQELAVNLLSNIFSWAVQICQKLSAWHFQGPCCVSLQGRLIMPIRIFYACLLVVR